MHVTKPADPTSIETWLTPPRTAKRMLARRAAAVVVALSLGLGGSLMAVGAASAEELSDSSETSQTADSIIVEPPVELVVPEEPVVEPPVDNVEGPEVIVPETLESSIAEVDPAGAHAEEEIEKKVRICHATRASENADNPYNDIEVSVNAFFPGHGDHADDIVPPFEYEEKDKGNTIVKTFPGRNWLPGGIAIWMNDCEIPEKFVPDPKVVVTPDVCTVKGGTTSSATIKLNNLVKGEEYTLSVFDKDGEPIGTFDSKKFTADPPTKDIVVTGLPAPGDYKAVLEWDDLPNGNSNGIYEPAAVVLPIKYSITVEFSLVKCPPLPPTLAETGANGSALPIGIGLLAVGSALMLATRLMRREQLFPPMV